MKRVGSLNEVGLSCLEAIELHNLGGRLLSNAHDHSLVQDCRVMLLAVLILQ